MNDVGCGNAGLIVVPENQRSSRVGSDSAVDTCRGAHPVVPPVETRVATVNPYLWFAGSYERSK
jgi:hypothetical protein